MPSPPRSRAENPAFAKQVLAALRREFAIAGRGAQARTARALGLSSSYYSQTFCRGGPLPIGVLNDTLAALDVDPADFFARLFPTSGDPLERFLRDARRLVRCRGLPSDLARLEARNLPIEARSASPNSVWEAGSISTTRIASGGHCSNGATT